MGRVSYRGHTKGGGGGGLSLVMRVCRRVDAYRHFYKTLDYTLGLVLNFNRLIHVLWTTLKSGYTHTHTITHWNP